MADPKWISNREPIRTDQTGQPKIDRTREQRIEIATRLMEAWLKGPQASNDGHVIAYKAEQFTDAANRIQTKSK